MHILLTDILTCPICGPERGLILRADRMTDRRVTDGALGCPNCRRSFPIRDGVALLDPDVESIVGSAGGDEPGTPDEEEALRMAALLGLQEPGGFAFIAGPAARLAGRIAALTEGVEIAADGRFSGAGGEQSRLVVGTSLPFYAGRLRGVWLSGRAADELLVEAVRTMHPTGRLVLEPAPVDAVQRLATLGLRPLARERQTVVAAKR